MIIEYDGTNFLGWQVQKKGKTVQGFIQQKISKLLGQKITLFGSGRTDAGVHAIAQSAHFDCKNKINSLNKFLKSLNYFLNKNGISIIKIRKRNQNFHARYSVKLRVYKYIIFNQLSAPVLQRKRGWHITKQLNLEIMKKRSEKTDRH